MPSAAALDSSFSASTSDLPTLLRTLRHALQTNPSAASSSLSHAKISLLHSNALIPNSQTPVTTLQTARSILETGALISIRLKDPQAFVRYWSQLQPFYDYSAPAYSPSEDRSKITGLYLLLLLSQGDYAAFHTVLEGLVAAEGEGEGQGSGSVVENDPFIRYPVELERSLMEGSYDQVWKGTMGEGVPGEEFALFSQMLMMPIKDFLHTIRREIASCAQSSYPSLPVSSAKNLFFLESEGAVVDFAHENGWSVEDGRIWFPRLDDVANANGVVAGTGGGTVLAGGDLGGQKETIQNMVGYARELEMIV